MAIEAKGISLWDTLRLQLAMSVPAFLWGLVAPNRFFVVRLARWNAGERAARLLDALRRKYGCDHLWAWFPIRRTLLVLDPVTADEVLRGDATQADPFLKKLALSRFVPAAVIVSRGQEWADRRAFNEAALGFGRLHDHAAAFDEIVAREAVALVGEGSSTLRWSDFEAFAQRVSQQVVLGAGQLEPALAVHLARLARRANLAVVPAPADDFASYYQRIEAHLDRHRTRRSAPPGPPAPADCLVNDGAAALDAGRATTATQVPRQIGFWFFVLKDALELHVARTLALIAAHPDVQTRARSEVLHAPALDAAAIDGMRYLEACLLEQLRLWTPVPILLRRTEHHFSLRGAIPVAPEQQILIHAGFLHRDARVFDDRADRFAPDAVSAQFPPLYVFSRGRQSCAGESLARFLLKAALATLLARYRFELVAPAIDPGRIPHLCNHFAIELRAIPAP